MTALNPVSQELRLRPRFAVVAGLGGVLLFAGAALQSAGPQANVNELTVQLLVTNRRAGLEVIGAVVNGLGLLALAATLGFLFSAVRARKPEMSQAMLITAAVGGILAAIGGIAYGTVITGKAHDFASHGLQTYPEANSLLSSGAIPALQYAGLLGSLLLAIAFVLVALNAMRVGLLTRFMGYLGMAAAAASLLLIGSAPALLIEVFWLLAVGYLLAGRWPNGDPPAWTTGQAVPWPSSAELRDQRQAATGRGRAAAGRGRAAVKPAPKAQAPAPPTPVSATSSTRSTTPKRKRKRRK